MDFEQSKIFVCFIVAVVVVVVDSNRIEMVLNVLTVIETNSKPNDILNIWQHSQQFQKSIRSSSSYNKLNNFY